MGKEKRLFLLAVMTVMMSTVGYGKTIGNNGNPFRPSKETIEIPKETEIQVDGTGDEGYRLNAGDTVDEKTIVTHNGKIIVNDNDLSDKKFSAGIKLNVAGGKLGRDRKSVV